MPDVAKLFRNGRSQAVRLPAAYRFEGEEVFVRRDSETGDVILSPKPADWKGFFAALDEAEIPEDFLERAERDLRVAETRDPLAGTGE